MIKIYSKQEIADTKQLFDKKSWNFPIEELDYLLEEHNNESFVLMESELGNESRLLEIEEQDKVYVIYEVNEENYEIINNLQVNYDIIKVFNDGIKAQEYLNELVKSQINKDDWTYTKNDCNGVISVDLYYCKEWRSCLYLKEMEVE